MAAVSGESNLIRSCSRQVHQRRSISAPLLTQSSTPIPGSREMRFDALVGSPLPDQLRDLGYVVTRTGESKRILPHAMRIEVVEMFDLRAPAGADTSR